MAGSIERVTAAAKAEGMDIEVKRMGASTRTSEEAAAQCGCSVDQIVKSLIFQGESGDGLYLFLLQGSSRLDLKKAEVLSFLQIRANYLMLRKRPSPTLRSDCRSRPWPANHGNQRFRASVSSIIYLMRLSFEWRPVSEAVNTALEPAAPIPVEVITNP